MLIIFAGLVSTNLVVKNRIRVLKSHYMIIRLTHQHSFEFDTNTLEEGKNLNDFHHGVEWAELVRIWTRDATINTDTFTNL